MCHNLRTAWLVYIFVAAAAVTFSGSGGVLAIRWEHSAQLDDAFRLLWSVRAGGDAITFEVQVRTHGYVAVGFARDGATMAADTSGGSDERTGADVVVGWVDRGQTYFQDRHFKTTGAVEPRIDPSEDYTLLLGYENATHTVLRFERRLDTCDTSHDVVITVRVDGIMCTIRMDEIYVRFRLGGVYWVCPGCMI